MLPTYPVSISVATSLRRVLMAGKSEKLVGFKMDISRRFRVFYAHLSRSSYTKNAVETDKFWYQDHAN